MEQFEHQWEYNLNRFKHTEYASHTHPSTLSDYHGRMLGNQLIILQTNKKKERSIYPAFPYCNMDNQTVVERMFLFLKIF